jgi:hypothetical protein
MGISSAAQASAFTSDSQAVGVSEDDEWVGASPEAEGFAAFAGFGGVEQGFVGGEVLGRGGQV